MVKWSRQEITAPQQRDRRSGAGDFGRDSGCVASSTLYPLSKEDMMRPGALFSLRLLGRCFPTISKVGNRD